MCINLKNFYVYGGGIGGSGVLVVMDPVVGLALCNTESRTADSENAPEEVRRKQILKNVAEGSVCHKAEHSDGANGRKNTDLRILNVGMIFYSVENTDDKDSKQAYQRKDSRLKSKLDKHV